MTRYYHSFGFLRRFFSVSLPSFSIFSLTLLAMIVFLVSSCEEDPIKMGKDFLPGDDFIKLESTDTLSSWSYTMYDDSIRTDNPLVTYLGEIYDPYFGRTTAELVTQVRLGGAWDPVQVKIDSVKLYIRFQDVKGSGKDITLKISEIDKQIYTDSAYYSNDLVPLADFSVSIDMPELKPDTINDLVLDIDTLFGSHILYDTTKLFYNSSQSDFRSYIKGFYFQMSSISDPTLVSVSLAAPTAESSYTCYFVIFLKNKDGLKKELLLIMDAVNRNAAFNKYTHYFNEATLDNMDLRLNNGHNDSLSYLQYLDGVYTKISLPGLKSLKNDPLFNNNIAINKARLTVPVHYDGDLYKASTAPTQLLLRYKTKSGSKYNVPDYYLDQNRAFFSGKLDTVANLYTFNIPAFVQKYLNDTVINDFEPELELYQSSGTRNAILKANSSKTPVKFNFTYTKF
jgi:hypothetical protein